MISIVETIFGIWAGRYLGFQTVGKHNTLHGRQDVMLTRVVVLSDSMKTATVASSEFTCTGYGGITQMSAKKRGSIGRPFIYGSGI